MTPLLRISLYVVLWNFCDSLVYFFWSNCGKFVVYVLSNCCLIVAKLLPKCWQNVVKKWSNCVNFWYLFVAVTYFCCRGKKIPPIWPLRHKYVTSGRKISAFLSQWQKTTPLFYHCNKNRSLILTKNDRTDKKRSSTGKKLPLGDKKRSFFDRILSKVLHCLSHQTVTPFWSAFFNDAPFEK